MKFSELSEEQLEELRDNYGWEHDLDRPATDEELELAYGFTEFYNDDFFCSAEE